MYADTEQKEKRKNEKRKTATSNITRNSLYRGTALLPEAFGALAARNTNAVTNGYFGYDDRLSIM